MNRADLLYACLRDGAPWTRRDIYEHTGEFFLTNNAAAELRKRGIEVLHTRAGRLDVYQIGPLTRRELSVLGTRSSRFVSDPLVDESLREREDSAAQPRAEVPGHTGLPRDLGHSRSLSESSEQLSFLVAA